MTNKFSINKSSMVLVALVFVLTCLVHNNVMAQHITDIQDVLKSIQDTVKIKKIEIIYFEGLTPVSVKQDIIEQIYNYKFIMKTMGQDVIYLSTLNQALKNTKIEKDESKNSRDLRWGIIFFDSDGRRMASIYVDRFIDLGYINSTPVQFTESNPSQGLSSWLKNNFLKVFVDSTKADHITTNCEAAR